MGDVVSLKGARKARARATREAQASANRAAFGRTKAQKAADTVEQARKDTLLDGAKITGAKITGAKLTGAKLTDS